MGISDGLYNVADVHVSGLSGVRGVGMSWLQFSLELRVNATAGYSAFIGNPVSFIYVAEALSGQFKPLGEAAPETSWFMQTNEYSHRDGFTVRLRLAGEQIEALERLRGGGSLFFRVDLHALVHGKQGFQRAFEQLNCEANLSIWSKVLKEFGHSELLLLTIELPVAGIPTELRSAVDQIHVAHADLIAGRYDAVVSRARMCLDGLDKHINGDAVGNRAIENFLNGQTRDSMTKSQRANLVRAAIRHYTHLAHHVDDAGDSVNFSRDDAIFILSAAAATVRDAIGRA